MIALVDYGMGNLRSVQKAFEREGAAPRITSDPKVVERAERIILPGVGAFDHAMTELRRRRLLAPLKGKILSGAPYLGICLGLQLLFKESEEGGRTRGLGVIEGRVRRFRKAPKTPHMGWNTLDVVEDPRSPLLAGVKADTYFYFVHSYFGVPEDRSWVAARTGYGETFCSALWKGNVFATQFHPEKSQKAGLALIRRFLAYGKKVSK